MPSSVQTAPTRPSRKSRKPLVLAAATMLWPILISGCQPTAAEATSNSAATAVTTHAIEYQSHYQRLHRLVGAINNQQTSNVGFELAGKVANINAAAGDTVAAGQQLASLDTALLRSDRQRLLASIEQLQSQLELNQSTLERQLQLQQQGYQSQQQLDELNSAKRSLQAQLQQAQAALTSNQLQLDKSVLKAPFSGTVSQRQLAPGQVVSAGQTLFTLVPNQGAEAKIGVPVTLLNKVGNQFDYQLSHQQQPISAQLIGRSKAVDATTRTVDLRFALPQQQLWFDGDLIYLELTENIDAEVVQVPISALISGLRGRWNLMVATATDGQWHLQRRDIQIIHSNDRHALVQGAIEEGELLVTEGLQRLVAGQQVTVTKAAL
ncbi:efflux RND transporter periplasmic adaptor subunit [Ferrimonas senticii]|uniref:efflux RND transporter periplasmic adaptor subunit n=1 Tax=Ferrimonas senticii TaxID=394566 RepID=UPI0004018326|nr:efflux RND transporter periplasmic adaptor subunit [Ferrimonas senticii]